LSGNESVIDPSITARKTVAATPSDMETRAYFDKDISARVSGSGNRIPESDQGVKNYAPPASSQEVVAQDKVPRNPVRSRMLIIAATVIFIVTGGVLVYIALRPSPLPPGMVFIPGGDFIMGQNSGQEDERPEHKLFVKSFYLDQFEVTNQKYKDFV